MTIDTKEVPLYKHLLCTPGNGGCGGKTWNVSFRETGIILDCSNCGYRESLPTFWMRDFRFDMASEVRR